MSLKCADNYESSRLESLLSLNILDTPPEKRFDMLTQEAQAYFSCKTCLISLVAEDRQWFKSRQGLDAKETPRNISFCTYAIAEEQYLIIPDAHEDFRFARNPLVTGAPFIRSYAGVILRSSEGYELGTLCLIHDKPKQYNQEDIAALLHFGKLVEAQLNQSSD